MTLASITNHIEERFDSITSAYLYASEAAAKRREINFTTDAEMYKMYHKALSDAVMHCPDRNAQALATLEFNNKLMEMSVRESSYKRANRLFKASRRREGYMGKPIRDDSFSQIKNIPINRRHIRPLGSNESIKVAFYEILNTLWFNKIIWGSASNLRSHYPQTFNFSGS